MLNITAIFVELVFHRVIIHLPGGYRINVVTDPVIIAVRAGMVLPVIPLGDSVIPLVIVGSGT